MKITITDAKESWLKNGTFIPNWKLVQPYQFEPCCEGAEALHEEGIIHLQTDGKHVGISFSEGRNSVEVKVCPCCGVQPEIVWANIRVVEVKATNKVEFKNYYFKLAANFTPLMSGLPLPEYDTETNVCEGVRFIGCTFHADCMDVEFQNCEFIDCDIPRR